MTDLIRKMEDQNKKTDYKDDRFWRPEIDKTGNGFAIIRFLPEVENEDCPWAKVYSHAFIYFHVWHHWKESNLHCRFRRPEYTPLYDSGIFGAASRDRT